MEIEQFLALGFNRNEAIVFIALIKFGSADAATLIKSTKFHKNIVYDNLEKLINRGLVTVVQEEGKRVYSVSSSEMLLEMVREEERNVQKKVQLAEKLSKQIESAGKETLEQQEATVFRGKQGIRAFFATTINGPDHVAFGSPFHSVDVMGEHFWRNLMTKREENKAKIRLLFNKSLKNYGETIQSQYTEVRYLEHGEPNTETLVIGDRVAIMVFTREPVLFLIHNKHVADSYLQYFEELWERSTL